MKLHTILRPVALAAICTLPTSFTIANKIGDGDTNNNDDPSSSSTEHEIISTPTYAQTMKDAIRDLMEDFSHMTSLHESFVHHPSFSRHRIVGNNDKSLSSKNKPFSTWGSFDSLTRWSPRYEVIDDATTFQVKLDVPSFHYHQMKVELESGGRVLSISGTKEDNVHEKSKSWNDKEKNAAMGEKLNDEEDEAEDKFDFSSHTSTSFQQKFTLDPSIDTLQMTANLVNGVLEVRAPRKQGTWNSKHVPITQFDEDVWAELIATDEAGEAEGANDMLKE